MSNSKLELVVDGESKGREPPKKNILVTGASGFVGKGVVKALSRRKEETGHLVATDLRQPEEELESVFYHRHDVREDGLEELLRTHQIDVLIHLAAIVTPGPGSSPELEYEVDVIGTRKVVEACLAAGVKKLIVTSSGAAYGYHPDNDAWLSEDAPLRGNEEFPYSRHKRMVEEELAKVREEHPELQQLIFRPGTILGEGVSNQITAIFEKPIITGLSDSPTPFVFIWDQDVVDALVMGALSEKTGIYNLAGDGVLTLREIAELLAKPYVAIPSRLMAGGISALRRYQLTQYGPEQVKFLQHRPVLSNVALKNDFGFTPRLSTREVFELYRREIPEARRPTLPGMLLRRIAN